MLTSVAWLNRYLDPADLTTEEAVRLLEAHAFPIEAIEPLPSLNDTQLDVELTSNRGDCFSHLQLAREIATVSGRSITPLATAIDPAHMGHAPVQDLLTLENLDHEACPRFTCRVIRGVANGPSPDWLRSALEAVGQRSINTLVDLSNFLLLETGNPNHIFDYEKVAGNALIVRPAVEGESVIGLDGDVHDLLPSDTVVADREGPLSVAGIVGGVPSSVTHDTTDIIVEVATWDPSRIRNTARRLHASTDAAYRFERTVDPRDIDTAMDRLCALILKTCGGSLAQGTLDAGAPTTPPTTITLRTQRAQAVLGIPLNADTIAQRLAGIEFVCKKVGDDLAVTIPPKRAHEISREIDLIEEVARLVGFDEMQVADKLSINLNLGHPESWDRRERAMDRLHRTLNAMGFYETITFTFLPETHALPFVPKGMRALKVDEARRPGTPYLRPALTPSLLEVRKKNQSARVTPPDGVRIYETASTIVEADKDPKARETHERRILGILMDAPATSKTLKADAALELGLRQILGVATKAIAEIAGDHDITITPANPDRAAFNHEAFATISINGDPVGFAATVAGETLSQWGLDHPVLTCELDLNALIALGPPRPRVTPLPAFPGIERDLSAIIDEATDWATIEKTIRDLAPANLTAIDFVSTFRSDQIGKGKKSTTLRLSYRDEARTLRHDEVDPQMARIIDALTTTLGAEIRT